MKSWMTSSAVQKPGAVEYTCNPSIHEVEATESEAHSKCRASLESTRPYLKQGKQAHKQ